MRIADLSKAGKLLGYQPQVPIEDGIPRIVEWFLEHRAAHPEEDRPVEAEPAIGWKTLAAEPAS